MPCEPQPRYVEGKGGKAAGAHHERMQHRFLRLRIMTSNDLIRPKDSKFDEIWNAIIRLKVVEVIGVEYRPGDRGV